MAAQPVVYGVPGHPLSPGGSGGAGLTISGTRDVVRGLEAAGDAIKSRVRRDLHQAAGDAGRVARGLFERQRRGHGKRPGMLLRSISARVYGTLVVLVAKAPHAHLFELGTAPHSVGPRRHPGADANPFIYPAADIVGRPLVAKLGRTIESAAETAWRRSGRR